MSEDMESQILDTWNINNRINLYMLAAVPKEALNDLSASKGRTVAEQFAHLHNVRLMWLKADRLMDPLRQEPRFQAAMRELKFPD